jgi:hypothetical protein
MSVGSEDTDLRKTLFHYLEESFALTAGVLLRLAHGMLFGQQRSRRRSPIQTA